jgi:hypothetical protein
MEKESFSNDNPGLSMGFVTEVQKRISESHEDNRLLNESIQLLAKTIGVLCETFHACLHTNHSVAREIALAIRKEIAETFPGGLRDEDQL